MTSTQSTTWPEGVIARYLTVGGAAVDVTEDEPGVCTVANCGGCPKYRCIDWTRSTGAHFDGSYREYQDRESAEQQAREWAQSHAEKCRAMPKPDPR
ncbi:hypothetical protein [Microbispora rosea]|uniref:hypothetical protein n=1 Tax=Microbispora rosea TaxID=58117 RepID=UPI0004C4443C|nr:hypothetical protein [Microbispora rosea]